MGVGEQRKDHGNLEGGDVDAEVLAGPPGGSSVYKVFKGSGIQDFVKDFKCFLLGFLRVKAQDLGERFEVRVPQRRDTRRRGWQGGGSEKMEIMEGPSSALENVRRDALEKIVCKAIVGTEEASGNRLVVPARVRHGL